MFVKFIPPSLSCALEDLEQQATVGRKEGGKHQRLDGHKLDENVEGWARGVLEWVTHSVTNHSGLVRIRTLWTKLPCMLCGSGLSLQSQHGFSPS